MLKRIGTQGVRAGAGGACVPHHPPCPASRPAAAPAAPPRHHHHHQQQQQQQQQRPLVSHTARATPLAASATTIPALRTPLAAPSPSPLPKPSPTKPRRNTTCRLTPQQTQATTSSPLTDAPTQPDLIFHVPGTSTQVSVFGIDHRSTYPHVGEFILRSRPQAVVVETAVSPQHGAAPGTCISCSDHIPAPQHAFFVRMFCELAARLREEAGDGGDASTSSLWQEMKSHYRGEQLAYISAFATGAKLVFGDRPKNITYRRLAALVSPVQLDEAFGQLCEEHYRSCLEDAQPGSTASSTSPSPTISQKVHITELIMMQEREAVMCKVLDDLCRVGLPQSGLPSPATSVVLVVGRSHLAGLQALWEGQRWCQLVGEGELSLSPIMSAPPPPPPAAPSDQEHEEAVKRGLLQAMMRMMVTQEVLTDMAEVLDALSPEQQAVVDAIEEVYGCSRMMLAALPEEQLAAVCRGNGCDMYQVLEPFRSLRPVYGGPAFTPDMITAVRSLNFELD